MKKYLTFCSLFLFVFFFSQRNMTNLKGTYYFSKYLSCNLNTSDCNFLGRYNTKVTFDIDENGAGSIVIEGPDGYFCDIEYNNIEYANIGKSVTFYTTKVNRIKWFIDNNNKSQSISLIFPNASSYSYTNQ